MVTSTIIDKSILWSCAAFIAISIVFLLILHWPVHEFWEEYVMFGNLYECLTLRLRLPEASFRDKLFLIRVSEINFLFNLT